MTSRRSLWALTLAGNATGRSISDDRGTVAFEALESGSSLAAPLETLRGRCVLIATARQLPTVLAAIELDGVARRILLCPPDLDTDFLPAILREASVDAVVSEHMADAVRVDRLISPVAGPMAGRDSETEWVLFTSGTTGRPKMVVHTLASLVGPLDDGLVVQAGPVWSTFYDVRRYGGLQILLRALLGGGSMVLSQADEKVGDFLTRAGVRGVTHISGTPSHWRRALMSPAAGRMAPAYVRLSGEIADQAILDALQAVYPRASVAHAFASTEAGVAFDVRDGRAGFPAALIDQPNDKLDMRVIDGTLRIRSSRTASQFLGQAARKLSEADGFVDTGDLVERVGDRYLFMGRREGVINVGGQKVYPEEVEAVINQHPAVRMSRVWARSSPITGAVVAADVVLQLTVADKAAFAPIRDDILSACRGVLAPFKVPVSIRMMDDLAIAASGKLVRRDA